MFGMKTAVLLLVLLIAVVEVLSREVDYCYAENDQPYLKFGTKTAYNFIHGGKTRYQGVPNCKPQQIWMLMRYGTRSPSREKISLMSALNKLRDHIIYNHENRGYGRLCNKDLDALRNWTLVPTLETAETLGIQGVEDLSFLAGRTKINFPDLFPPVVNQVDSKNYEFRSGDGDPTMTSAKSFASGLFEHYRIPDVLDTPNGTLFPSYKNCPSGRNEVENNSEFLFEANKFSQGMEYQNMISNVSRRLGIISNLPEASITLMYDMCRYDKSRKVDSVSPWCAAFSEEDLRVLEYKEDLVEYYKHGYGNEMNLRMGCPQVQDMFDHFQKLEGGDSSNEPKGVFYVSKLDSLELFLSAMGFAKDWTPLRADNYRSMNKRQWKTSEIGSFAANIAAVFYKCENERPPNKVMFYLAEKPVTYEGCKVGLCDWEYLKSKFERTLSECRKSFCNTNAAVSHVVLSYLIMIPVFIPTMIFFSQ